jgi:Zn-dependent protease with chaperone function
MFWWQFTFANKQQNSATLISNFLKKSDHQWIRKNRILQNRIIELLTKLSESDLHLLTVQEQTCLSYSDGLWSSTFSKNRRENVILIFPRLYKLFLSAEYRQAQAILAHEIGHILLGHNRTSISLLQAQLEADAFAKELGLSDELAHALLDFPIDQEILSRVQELKK